MLSGKELMAYRKPSDRTLPKYGGQKDFEPTGSEFEANLLSAIYEERDQLLSEERVERLGCLSQAIWRPELKSAEITKDHGKFWQTSGYSDKGKKLLYPEEAVYLMELAYLELYYGKVPLSIQEAYVMLLNEKGSIEKYQVYAYLSRLGYVVIRHQSKNVKLKQDPMTKKQVVTEKASTTKEENSDSSTAADAVEEIIVKKEVEEVSLEDEVTSLEVEEMTEIVSKERDFSDIEFPNAAGKTIVELKVPDSNLLPPNVDITKAKCIINLKKLTETTRQPILKQNLKRKFYNNKRNFRGQSPRKREFPERRNYGSEFDSDTRNPIPERHREFSPHRNTSRDNNNDGPNHYGTNPCDIYQAQKSQLFNSCNVWLQPPPWSSTNQPNSFSRHENSQLSMDKRDCDRMEPRFGNFDCRQDNSREFRSPRTNGEQKDNWLWSQFRGQNPEFSNHSPDYQRNSNGNWNNQETFEVENERNLAQRRPRCLINHSSNVPPPHLQPDFSRSQAERENNQNFYSNRIYEQNWNNRDTYSSCVYERNWEGDNFQMNYNNCDRPTRDMHERPFFEQNRTYSEPNQNQSNFNGNYSQNMPSCSYENQERRAHQDNNYNEQRDARNWNASERPWRNERYQHSEDVNQQQHSRPHSSSMRNSTLNCDRAHNRVENRNLDNDRNNFKEGNSQDRNWRQKFNKNPSRKPRTFQQNKKPVSSSFQSDDSSCVVIEETSFLPSIKARSWKEFKKEAKKFQDKAYLRKGSMAHLWTGDIEPLTEPKDARSSDAINAKLSIVQGVNLSLTDTKINCLDNYSGKFEIVYDVYLPNSKFRKRNPPSPHLRIVICNSSEVPRLCDIIYLQRKAIDGIPLQFAVVNFGEVSFYSFNDICIPYQFSQIG